jgi:hypothetical protein
VVAYFTQNICHMKRASGRRFASDSDGKFFTIRSNRS